MYFEEIYYVDGSSLSKCSGTSFTLSDIQSKYLIFPFSICKINLNNLHSTKWYKKKSNHNNKN